MKTYSLHELKNELQELPPSELLELCIKLAKYKKDNKEFLAYCLFEAGNKPAFMNEIKTEIDEHIRALQSQSNAYYAKKGLRKLLRILSRYSKYINDKALSAEMLIYLCLQLKQSGIAYVLAKIYEQQLKKINALLITLHEDLRQDYLSDLEKISV
ncbi:MAG TPA: hypothetical protein VF411_15090 [Bacteroidia bacterium]